MKWFFTYGKDPEANAHVGGWSVVIAETRADAIAMFNDRYPKRGFVSRYASVYPEDVFTSKKMFTYGNFGAFEHEVIS